jgi:hypothetical protein
MRTEDLIAGLARDAAPALPPPRTLVARRLAVAGPVVVVLFALGLGLRDDALGAALASPWFGLKLALAASLAATGLALLLALATPGRRAPVIALGGVAAGVILAATADLALLGAGGAATRLIGDNGLKCLVAIPLLAALPLAGLLLALADSAPVRPTLAGAAAGLCAAGLAAVLYGLHCTDDSPLFFAVWYLAASAVVVAAGAWAGRRWLTW